MLRSRSLSWFIGSALFGALACSPSITEAASRTLGREAFKVLWQTVDRGTVLYTGVGVTFPVGSDFSSGEIVGAYFDYRDRAGKTIRLEIKKGTFSGSIHTDYMEVASLGEQVWRDIYVPAVNIRNNASQYDYISARLSGPTAYLEGDVWGVALMK